MYPESAMTQGAGPSQLPAALSDRLGFLLGQAHEQHRRLAAGRFAELGIAPKEFGALSVLADEGPLTQQRLGHRMGVDRTTMVAVADSLESGGLVARERNPADRRAYALRLTTKGRRTLARAQRVAVRAENDFLVNLGSRERAQLRAMLRRVITP
jgi:DNA-binding MarR family transcriptional regulator